MVLSQNKTTFIKNGGWSAHRFFEHAKFIIPLLEDHKLYIDYGRHVIHVKHKNKVLIRIYVHKKGRSNEYMTVTNNKGTELNTFHCSISPESLYQEIVVLVTAEM